MDAPARRAGGEPRGLELLGGISENAKVVLQLTGPDRRVADAERADHVLAETPGGEGLAGGTAPLRLPEIRLEELGGVREHRDPPVALSPVHLHVPHNGYTWIVPDRLYRR